MTTLAHAYSRLRYAAKGVLIFAEHVTADRQKNLSSTGFSPSYAGISRPVVYHSTSPDHVTPSVTFYRRLTDVATFQHSFRRLSDQWCISPADAILAGIRERKTKCDRTSNTASNAGSDREILSVHALCWPTTPGTHVTSSLNRSPLKW